MRTWKIVLVGAVLGAMSIVTMGAVSIVSPGGPGRDGQALVASVSSDPDDPTASAEPITPGQTAVERAYGWGPFRVIDW